MEEGMADVVVADVAGTYPTNQTATVRMTEKEVTRFRLADAMDRAWRTFKSGIGLDIAIAVAIVVAPAVTNLEWTPTYWTVLGTAVAKSVLTAVTSYVLRRKSTPKVGLQV
jgi:hypothetical protein